MQVKKKLDLSYHNVRRLHQVIDALPGLPPWQHTDMSVRGLPERFNLTFRDPVKCLQPLFRNRALLRFMTFAPEMQFSDADRKSRLYNEMHTGDWWNQKQVRLTS